MSAAISSCCSCPTPEIVQVPGSPGASGASQANSINSTTITDATLAAGFVTVPGAVGVVGSVANPLPIVNGGTGQTSQSNALTALLGASFIPLANGGTGAVAATRTSAQAGLGLGQLPLGGGVGSGAPGLLSGTVNISALSTATAIAQSLPISIASAGVYMLVLQAVISGVGATVQASQVVTLELRNNATPITGALVANTFPAATPATTSGSLLNFTVIGFATFTAGQVANVYVTMSAAPTAGTVLLQAATLIAIPIALS
jgi:hypothetical protein